MPRAVTTGDKRGGSTVVIYPAHSSFRSTPSARAVSMTSVADSLMNLRVSSGPEGGTPARPEQQHVAACTAHIVDPRVFVPVRHEVDRLRRGDAAQVDAALPSVTQWR